MKPVSSAHVTLRFRVGKPVLCTASLPRIKRSKPSDSSCGTRCNAGKQLSSVAKRRHNSTGKQYR